MQGALIAAIYAALTYFSAPIAFGPAQFRIAEAMTLLPVLTPAAIPGLAVGCIIANLSSPYGIADIICGTLATLLAALCSRAAGKIRFKNIPLLSALFPVLFNGIIIGVEISLFIPEGADFWAFITSGAGVALGEFVSCFVLGLPLFAALDRTKLFK